MGLFNFKRNKDNTAEDIFREGWNFYAYTYGDDLRAFIEFDFDIAMEEEHVGYDYCKRVIIHSESKNVMANGLPLELERKRVNYLENELLSAISGVDCKYTGKMHYSAMRDLNFQTNEPDKFISTVEKWKATQKSNRIQVLESDGWDFYDEKVKPDFAQWQKITSRKLIGMLLEKGSNANKQHKIEHLFIGDTDKLEFLKEQLRQDNFDLISLSDNKLTLSKPALLNEELSDLSMKLARYTAGIGVKYDGWGAMIEK